MAKNNKAQVTVTIVVQRGNEEWRSEITGDEVITTPGDLDFVPLEEMAENLVEAIYEIISDGPNPDWDS